MEEREEKTRARETYRADFVSSPSFAGILYLLLLEEKK